MGRSDVLTIAIRRVFPAACSDVFQAFVDPSQFAKWFGPQGYAVAGIEFTPRAGERYRIEMQPPEGEHFHITGEVREADPPRRLAFTFIYEEPNPDDVETEVRLSFSDLGGSTEVDLTQGTFKTEARCALHRDGWGDSLDKLARFLAQD